MIVVRGRGGRAWGRVRLGACALAVVLLGSGCGGIADPSPPSDLPQPVDTPAPDSFVTTDGGQFTAGGFPFRFVGANIYNAAGGDIYTCNTTTLLTDEQLDATLTTLHRYGVTVIRFWAYSTYTDDGRDFRGVDRVIDAARRHGMRVMPVLEDGPGDCTAAAGGQPKMQYRGDSWFQVEYARSDDGRKSFSDYAVTIAAHYRDEPTILGWTLINEAETQSRTETGESALVGFARDVAARVKSTDPYHLITLGTQSNGAPGASGPDFTAIYSLPQIDFAEVHDWGRWGSDTAAMPGGEGNDPPEADDPRCRRTDAPIGCSFALAAALDKPLVVGEAGIAADDNATRARRADLLEAKMSAAFRAGADGYLVWSVTPQRTDGYDVIVLGPYDPLLAVLARERAFANS